MADKEIHVGSPPDFVMSSGKIIYRHTVSILFIQNKLKQRVMLSNNSQIEVAKQLRKFLQRKELDGTAKIEWGRCDILTGSIRETNVQIFLKYKLPIRVSAQDREHIYLEFAHLLVDF